MSLYKRVENAEDGRGVYLFFVKKFGKWRIGEDYKSNGGWASLKYKCDTEQGAHQILSNENQKRCSLYAIFEMRSPGLRVPI